MKREFGVIGLGRMGANLSLQALEKGIRVVGFDIKGVSEELRKAGMVEVNSLDGFREKLSPARPIFIYVPAGHFTKLVHNGIEFGMLQAIGEGIDLLEHYQDKLEITEVLRCWRNGSVTRSWLIDLMEESYRAEDGLENIPSYVEDTGEVNWLINDAFHMEVPVPVISQAVMQLFMSRNERKNWARAIAMMRHGFGGHPYGSDESIVQERKEGKIGD